MERKLFARLYPFVIESVKGISQRRVRITHDVILLVFFWAHLHDRPMNWAVKAENWPEDLCPQSLPSASTMSRRLRQPELARVLDLISAQLQNLQTAPTYVTSVDAKPLSCKGLASTQTR